MKFRKRTPEPVSTELPETLGAWEMLDEAGIATYTARLRARYPDRYLVAVARRVDRDAVAAFDKGPDGSGKAVVVLEHVETPAKTSERRYPGFGPWFDDALAGWA